ncbi:hypothetical protein TNCT6_02820 [Streptomyces sp. 6-11-2]|nr:hypothetical protein TNCT6_02820 [Streptomyces sp. 6-11-2]
MVPHDDPSQRLGLRAGPVARSVPAEAFQQPAGVVAGDEDSRLGPGGVLAQTDRPAVAAAPLLVDQADQQMSGCAGDFFQRGTDCLGDQFQPGQVAHCGEHVGGVGALRGSIAHESGLLQAGERQIEKTVGTVVLGEALAEVGQHAVVEAGIVQFHGQRVCEVEAAAHRLGGLSVGQAEQELQNRDGGQLGGREAGSPVARVPIGEVLVVPQSVEAGTYPYRRRTARVARPRDLRGQRQDLLTGTERRDNGHLDNCIGLRNSPEHAR